MILCNPWIWGLVCLLATKDALSLVVGLLAELQHSSWGTVGHAVRHGVNATGAIMLMLQLFAVL